MGGDALPETCAPRRPVAWIRPAHAAYLGPSMRLRAHATSVHCVVVGVDAPFDLRIGHDEPITVGSALVPPRRLHQVVAPDDARMLFCYLDANHEAAEEYRGRFARSVDGFGVDHVDEESLVRLCCEPEGAAILDAVAGPDPYPMDDRITSTVERLLHFPSLEHRAADCAAQVELSLAHFLRLFGRETGTTFRRYRMWARMLCVARDLAKGGDITTAAADAGFASPSHFSDTFRTLCGISAFDLLGTGLRLIVLDGRVPTTRRRAAGACSRRSVRS